MSPTAAHPSPTPAPAPEVGHSDEVQGQAWSRAAPATGSVGNAAGYPAGYPVNSAAVNPAVAPAPAGKGLGISSLVLGLVSIVAGWTFFAPIAGLIAGIMALSREPANRTMAIWGIVLNAVMMIGWLLIVMVFVGVGLILLPFALVL